MAETISTTPPESEAPTTTPQTPAPATSGDTPKPETQPETPAQPAERTVPYDRFKEVNEKLKALTDAQEAADKKRLEDEGKWKELAEANEAKAKAAEEAIRQSRIENKVISEAAKLGVTDPSDALALLNKSSITVADDGSVTGVEDALKSLVEAKPYLVTKEGTIRVGSGTNPTNPTDATTTGKILKSQIQDTKFFRENEKAIMEALRTGNVVDDTATAPR